MLCVAQSWYKPIHPSHCCKPPKPLLQMGYRGRIGAAEDQAAERDPRVQQVRAGTQVLGLRGQDPAVLTAPHRTRLSPALLLTCVSPTLTLLKLYWKIRKSRAELSISG